MDPFGIGLGFSAVGAAASWWNRQEQARRQRDESEEVLRRTRAQHEQVLGEATAQGAASGVEFESGSLQQYLATMRDEFSRQEQWLARAGARQADATSTAANLGLLTDLGGAFFQYGRDSNWWKKPSVT